MADAKPVPAGQPDGNKSTKPPAEEMETQRQQTIRQHEDSKKSSQGAAKGNT